ncbi:MAG TPA: BatA domain-containing protein, partial [Planctomycetota bacterium]|nr:BatA domain-containing protein [Planctomycetota bacterium]
MSFAAPLALFALLAVPAVVALHLFHRRYRPRRVAALFLYAPGVHEQTAGRARTPLRRSASLLVEIAAATALALWLAGPRVSAWSAPQHVVAVLDDSASMATVGRGGESAAARARAVVEVALAEAGRDARVTLIATGPRPRVLCGPAAPAAAAADALAAWDPTAAHHEFAPALALAGEVAGRDATVLFVTDAPVDVPAGVGVRAVGEPADNAAIVRAQRVPREGGERLWIDAAAFAAGPMTARLTVRALDGSAAFPGIEAGLQLEVGRIARYEFDLPEGLGAVEVALGGDALALDDRVTLLPEPRRTVGVAVRLPAETADALQLGHALRALGSAVELRPGEPDLEITAAPGQGGFLVQCVVVPGEEPVESWLGPFLLERRHRLLDGITLEGVVWTAGVVAVGRGLAFAGDRALLGEEVLGERLRVSLALDPARSNLSTSPDWPILITNLVAEARARLPGPERVNVRLGEPIVWRERADATGTLRLVDPAGAALPGAGVQVVTFHPERPGLHVLQRDGAEVQRFAVHFADPRESDLRACATATVAARPLP